MQQSPSWQANRFSASQGISHILWNKKVHYRIHKIHLNIILPSTPGSYKWPFSPRFPHQNILHVSPISFFSIW
jgi:hypothetical protein